MPRPRQRVCLEDGLKLDLNEIVRDGFLPSDEEPVMTGINWTSNIRGVIESAGIVIERHEEDRASFGVLIPDKLEQWLDLIAQPRHFGGQQWYFLCPVTHKRCSIVWLPPGASRFCSRQAWGKEVAYSTQYEAPFNRAISAREKVKSRLIGDLDRREWELPPKPKWMRWDTYERLAEKYHLQQGKIDQIIADYMS